MLTRGWAINTCVNKDLAVICSSKAMIVNMHIELGLSYLVPRGLLYSGIRSIEGAMCV